MVCQTGYSVVNGTCVNCSIPNCLQCSQAGICSSCLGNFVLANSGTLCQVCLNPCASCGTNGICLTCIFPYSVNPNTNGQCYTCTDYRCTNCNFPNVNFCNACIPGFNVTSGGTCANSCPQQECQSCSTTNSSQCSSCIPGYYVDQNSAQCTLCAYAPRCMTCVANQPTICIKCANGFYLNSNSSCSACPLFCATCSSATTCITLLSPIGNAITTVNGQSVLGVCDPGCYSCSQTNPSSCTVCIPGFYLTTIGTNNANLGVCTPCTNTQCMYCSTTNPNTCLSCFAGAFLSNGACTSCNFPCVTCNNGSASSCTSCPSGYVLYANSTCAQISSNSTCGQNCGTCTQASSSASPACINCLAGFVLAGGYCVMCPNACSVCSLNQNTLSNNQPTCTACNVGYYLNTQSSQCQSCSTGCGACYNSTICLTCLTGYSLTSTYYCNVNCAYPCATCSAGNAFQCTTCVNGFTFESNNNTCSSNVNTCNSGSNCTVCPFGYNLLTNGNSQTCVACDTNSKCARCNPSSTSTCTSCMYGYYLNKGICNACGTGCSNCLDSNTCFRCFPGYLALLPATLVTGSSTSPLLTQVNVQNNIIYQPVTCVICTSPCVTCISSPTSCLSCKGNYTLVGTACVSNFNFGSTVVLSTTPSNFVQNYYNFLVQISNAVGQQINTITVSSIQYGSATVNFAVSTTNAFGSPAAQTQQTNLQNAIASNQTIAGMQVSSSTMVLNGAPTPDNNNSNNSNTTLIIAIVVPIASLSTFLFI